MDMGTEVDTYEFAFELPDGRWLHKATEVFENNEDRARD